MWPSGHLSFVILSVNLKFWIQSYFDFTIIIISYFSYDIVCIAVSVLYAGPPGRPALLKGCLSVINQSLNILSIYLSIQILAIMKFCDCSSMRGVYGMLHLTQCGDQML